MPLTYAVTQYCPLHPTAQAYPAWSIHFMTAPPCTLPPKFMSVGSARNRSVISHSLSGITVAFYRAAPGRAPSPRPPKPPNLKISRREASRPGSRRGQDRREARVARLKPGLLEDGPIGDLAQDAPTLGSGYPAGGELGVPAFELPPDERAVQLLGRHRRRTRPRDEVVVEGVAGAPPDGPDEGLVGVGPRKLGQRRAWHLGRW